jgi:uncharacterized surface anchored protein
MAAFLFGCDQANQIDADLQREVRRMSGIKSKVKTLLSLMLIFAMVIMSFPSMADAPYDYQGAFTVYAGQHISIGTASVIVDDGKLTITVRMDPDWPADEYHLYLLNEAPSERPTPGHAPYSNGQLGGACSFTIGPLPLNLSGSGLDPGQCINRYLVLHLTSGKETAYAGDIVKPDSGAWFGYIAIPICALPTPDGSITLIKRVVDSQGHELSSDATEFKIKVQGPTDYQTFVKIIGNSTAEPLTGLKLGDYTISEHPPEGYTLLSIQSGPEVLKQGVITLSEADPHAVITVTNQKNDDQECAKGSLTILKKVVDDEMAVLETDETTFEIMVHGNSPVHYQKKIEINGNGTYGPITELKFGDYTISETAPTGYTLLAIQSGETVLSGGVITLSEADPHKTITIINQKDSPEEETWGSLTLIKKVVDNQGQTRTSDRTEFTIKLQDSNDFEQSVKLIGHDGTDTVQLKLGDYTLSELVPEGYILKSITWDGQPLTDGSLTLDEGHPDATITITNEITTVDTAPKGAIRILKFRDHNRDGDMNGSDSLLSGISFKLETAPLPEDPPSQAATQSWTLSTGSGSFGSGEVIFENLPYGRYKLTELSSHEITGPEDLKDGEMFIQVPAHDSQQTPVRVELAVGNYAEPPAPPPPPVTPPSTQDIRGEIRIHKFLDSNKNNHYESTEFHMENVTFELYNADKTMRLQSKKTDADGLVTFSSLPLGTYYLREVSEYEITSPEFGADGFSKSPIAVNTSQAIVFSVGNFRNTVERTPPTEVVPPETPPTGTPPAEPPTPEAPPDKPPDTEIVEEEPPPLALPPTGEVPPLQMYVLGVLLMLAGIFLKRLN